MMVPSLPDTSCSFPPCLFPWWDFFSCAFHDVILVVCCLNLLKIFVLWRPLRACLRPMLELDFIWLDLLQTKVVIYLWFRPVSTLVTTMLATWYVCTLSPLAVWSDPAGDRRHRPEAEHGWSSFWAFSGSHLNHATLHWKKAVVVLYFVGIHFCCLVIS